VGGFGAIGIRATVTGAGVTRRDKGAETTGADGFAGAAERIFDAATGGFARTAAAAAACCFCFCNSRRATTDGGSLEVELGGAAKPT
jgi:hypothetical protein